MLILHKVEEKKLSQMRKEIPNGQSFPWNLPAILLEYVVYLHEAFSLRPTPETLSVLGRNVYSRYQFGGKALGEREREEKSS